MTSDGCVLWQQPMYTQSPEPDLRYRPSASEASSVLGAVRNRHTCITHQIGKAMSHKPAQFALLHSWRSHICNSMSAAMVLDASTSVSAAACTG
jgi:hypothetical protein